MTDIQKENKSGGKVPNNPKQIPNLRFTNFSEPWKSIRLADICEINPKNESLPSSFIYIDLESVANGQLLKEDFISKNEAPSRAQRVLSKNDVLFQMVRPYQKNNLFFDKEGKYVASTGYAQIRTKQNPQFVFQYLHNQRFVDNVIERCIGTSYPAINSKDLGNIQIDYPCLEEQKKISSFLALLDERIQTQNKIIKGLKSLKIALAKKIFSQELRLKDDNGNDFSEWEEDCLENVCDIKKGEQFNKEDLNEIGLYPCLNGGISPSGFSEKYNTDENTITISEGGNSCGFVNFMKTKFWLGGHCYKILLFKKISLMYFYQLLKFNEQNVMNLRVGSGLPNIQMKSLKRFTIKISTSESEQNKIANFLSAIDSKIDIESQLLQKLEEQKKFLLQNMFV